MKNQDNLSSGVKTFYNDYKQLHREDGPAVQYVNGNEEWWIKGRRHRSNGPAAKFFGREYWYINGNNISTEVDQWMEENDITYPFNRTSLILFQMRFL